MSPGPVVTPVELMPGELAQVRFTADGLVAAIAQDRASGRVLMLGWMNEATLRETLETGRMVYWSRSRQERWAKGDTSGNRQWVREAFYDCDGDVLLFLVEQEGEGACHTGSFSCFYRRFGGDGAIVGRPIRLSGRTLRVVGVLPEGFQHVGSTYRSYGHGEPVDVWTVLVVPREEKPQHRFSHYYNVVARMRRAAATHVRLGSTPTI